MTSELAKVATRGFKDFIVYELNETAAFTKGRQFFLEQDGFPPGVTSAWFEGHNQRT